MVGPKALLYTAALVVLVLAGALHVLAAAGHFPREHRDASLGSKLGSETLFCSLTIMAVCVLSGTIAAFRLIDWPVGIIGAGLSILAAPVLLRLLPDRIVDAGGTLVALTFTAAFLSAFMIWIAFF